MAEREPSRVTRHGGPVVVLTGASSGIGASLALAWARRGARIVLSGRNEVALARVARQVTGAGGQAFVEAGDVTDDAHRVALVARAEREGGRIDVLVNNAGKGYYGAVEEVQLGELEALFALNVFAPFRLAQLSLGPLAHAKGTVVMMSSVAGVVAAPRMGAYAASKFALEAMSMALRAEVAARGIRVLVIRPGPVDTPFRDHAVSSTRRDGVSESGVRPPGATVQTPDAVAEMTVAAVARRRSVVETSLFVRVASLSARVAPAALRAISARMATRSKH